MKRGIPKISIIIIIAHFIISAFYATVLSAAEFTPGIPVGEKIPPFEAKDQQGKVQTFESIRGPKGAFLVFYRSADW
jgi:hypothetical protein